MRAMADPNSPLSKLPIAKKATDPNVFVSLGAFFDIVKAHQHGDDYSSVLGNPKNWKKAMSDAWAKTIEVANKNYEPGKFTTFIAYEWTSTPDGKNLHRNIIFRGDWAPQPFRSLDSKNPEDLWKYLEKWRRKGVIAVAIPHNPNASDGIMFGPSDYNGKPITADYARRRAFFEREVEIIQIKGQSETNPFLSPNDEFADFEVFKRYLSLKNPITHFAGGSERDALRTGLLLQEKEGVNPYKFGFVGGSDSHDGVVHPTGPFYTVPAPGSGFSVFRTYVRLGLEHIAGGIDHLLFVTLLVLLIGRPRRILTAVTAFTIAHSISLALAALGIVHVPLHAVEALIALSILFMAVEIAPPAKDRAFSRAPWAIAFGFGLLHGLGFASGLAEIGLPHHEIPLALISFNVGVEIGQFSCVGVLLAFGRLMRGTSTLVRARALVLALNLIGGFASYWTIQRTIANFHSRGDMSPAATPREPMTVAVKVSRPIEIAFLPTL
jgi:hypothetical protein